MIIVSWWRRLCLRQIGEELARKGTDVRDLATQYLGRGFYAGLLGGDLATVAVDGEDEWWLKKSDLGWVTT